MFLVHWKQEYFNNCFSSFWNSYAMCNGIVFLNFCSHKMNTFLIQHINLARFLYILGLFIQYLF